MRRLYLSKLLLLTSTIWIACCGKKAGEVTAPEGDEIPAFMGVYLWTDEAMPLKEGGTILWRGADAPPLEGIIIHHQTLASGMVAAEKVVELREVHLTRKEVEYVRADKGGPNVAVAVRDAGRLIAQPGGVRLRFMPLEKPGAILAVPEQKLAPGAYLVEFMDKSYGFSVDAADGSALLRLPGKAHDEVLFTQAAGGDFSWDGWVAMMQNIGGRTHSGSNRILNKMTRPTSTTDMEAVESLQAASEAWKTKNYEKAVPAATVAAGHHPQDEEMRAIIKDGPMLAATAAFETRDWHDAERWARHASFHTANQAKARQMLTDIQVLRAIEKAELLALRSQWRDAMTALDQVSYDIRADARLETARLSVLQRQAAEIIGSHVKSKAWDEAVEAIREAQQRGHLSEAARLAWMSKIRAGAAADDGYWGPLFQPVWRVKLGKENDRVRGMRRTPHADQLVVWISDHEQRTVRYAGLKASTGEVMWRTSSGGPPQMVSSGGRYVIERGRSSQDGPDMARVIDLQAGREMSALRREWPANHGEVPFAIHEEKKWLAMTPGGAAFAVDVYEMESGRQLQHITVPGAARERTSMWNKDPYVRSMAFSPDGKSLAVIDEDDVVRVFDPATGSATGPGYKVEDSARTLSLRVRDGGTEILMARSFFTMNSLVYRKLAAGTKDVSFSSMSALDKDWMTGIEVDSSFGGQGHASFRSLREGGRRYQDAALPFRAERACFDDEEHAFYAGGSQGEVALFMVAAPLKALASTGSADAGLAAKLAAFIQAHHQKESLRDHAGIHAHYSEQVDYYDEGMVSRERVLKSKQTYFARWKTLTNTLPLQPEPRRTQEGTYRAVYPMHFKLVDGKGAEKSGKVEVMLELTLQPGGSIQIIREKCQPLKDT